MGLDQDLIQGSSISNSDLKKIKELIKSRGTIKGRLTRFKEYVSTLNIGNLEEVSDLKLKELQFRLEKVENLLFEFNEVQSQIENLSSAEDDGEVDSFESIYYSTLALAQHMLESRSKAHEEKENDLQSARATCSNSCSHHNLNNIKLPTIKLPSYDGNYLNWLEYRDTFESLIHKNDSISNINKFHYLRSSLEGGAAIIIKSLEFSSKNYIIAWDLIRERYDNKKVLINNHLKALFEMNSIAPESHKAIRFVIDHVYKNVRALNSLEQPTDKWDILIIYLVSTKLDSISFSKWEEHKNTFKDLPTLSEFMQFLRDRADILEAMAVGRSDKREYKPNFYKDSHKGPEGKNKIYNHNKTSKSFVTHADTKSTMSCPFCNQQHRIIDCSSFKKLCPEDRCAEVSKLKLCLNCLRRGHASNECRLMGTCKVCKKKHNTLLHVDAHSPEINTSLNHCSYVPVSLPTQCTSQVLLGTALVKIINPENKNTYLARALLDAGSQSSFITVHLKEKMKYFSKNTDTLCISGINNCKIPVSDSCELTIQSRVNDFHACLKCLVVEKITGLLPNTLINVAQLNLPPNIQLADPKFFRPSNVDLLLGADIFYELMSPNKIKLGSNKPVLQESKLGWIVADPLYTNNLKENKEIHCNFTKEIRDQLTKFWTLEELPTFKPTMSADDEFCERYFTDTTTRLNDGRFSVFMPFKESPEIALGDSYRTAEKRFLSLEKKLIKNSSLKEEYCKFIKEYEGLGHLTEINKPKFGYYLPHHAVIRQNSETTKLRVVFDGSAKSSSGKSLNSIQHIGPVVQDELFNILVRFRQHKFVCSGDIQKMYRQIMIDESQRHLQLILWRDEAHMPLRTLQLNTVTYGTACAPYLSTRCLVQLAMECPDPIVSQVIKNDFFVDDLLTGASTEDDLSHILMTVTQVLDSAGFPIHKFRTNCPKIHHETAESDLLNLCKETSVLGVLWAPKSDTLRFQININEHEQNITKRVILSNTCKIFDPLGLLSACTITLKTLLQQLWQLKLDWDDSVPLDIKRAWEKIIRNLNVLLSLSIPRFVLCSFPVHTQLHCFVDASQTAYAACIYLRSTDIDGNVTTKLLCAKTRVAPLKTVTIPRLELCAALLGARLATKIIEALRCKIDSKTFWSDSTITLGWIKTRPKLLKAFVCNRVNEIHELTERDSWKHVPTDVNPADLASRGIDPKSLVESVLWWNGPLFLSRPESEWPQQQHVDTDLQLPEIKVHHALDDNYKFIQFDNYSNSLKLKRIFAYVLRFVHNCIDPIRKIVGSLNETELHQSLTLLLKLAQQETFNIEINALNKNKSLKPKSNILQLSPFIDDNGLLRVGGRLKNAALNYEKKHPILLQSNHHFTKILMISEHHRLFHAGPQLLLSSFREQFWPIGGRTLARSIVRKCVTCVRLKGKTMEPLMGDLPKTRVSESYTFQITGTDFAGPFMIASKKGRGSRTTKCYLCIFICFSTKAVHLETVSDLTSQAFISCLKRFIARRGKPQYICCDNGKNFVGANNELGKVLRSDLNNLSDFAANKGIKFVFTPPYSPTFAGLWEAGIKSAKYHLKRIAGNVSLTYEELSTLFTQIEAILNSRPLTPLSPDPNDFSPLTPGHFLIGRPLMSLPSAQKPGHTSIRTRYELIEQLRCHFWKRWMNEYLAELQVRTKWRSNQPNLKPGDMVVIKEPNLPPLKWKLGRVQELHPGNDGVVRVAEFLTHRGVERRAVNKVCLLPTTVEDRDVLEEAPSSSKEVEDVGVLDRHGSAGGRRSGARGAVLAADRLTGDGAARGGRSAASYREISRLDACAQS